MSPARHKAGNAAPPLVDVGDPAARAGMLAREMAALPGRLGNTLRLAVLVLLVVAIAETFRIPDPAVSAYIVLFVSREEGASSVMSALVAGIAVILAIFITILVFMLSLSEPALRLPLIALVTFAAMFVSRITALGPVFFAGGFIVAYGLTLGDHVLAVALAPGIVSDVSGPTLPELTFIPPEEALLHSLLWLTLAVALPVAAVVMANLLTGRDPALMVRQGLADRVAAAADFCEGRPGAARTLATVAGADNAALAKLHHLAGVWRKRVGFVDAAAIGQSRRLCAALLAWSRIGAAGAPDRLRAAGVACRQSEAALRGTVKLAPAADEPVIVPANALEAPLAAEISRDIHGIQMAIAGGGASPVRARAAPAKSMFVADAFSNPAYARFAFKVTLGVMLCYLGESLADWPGIHTCIITCFFVSLGSVGETLHKMTLRITGCLIGAALGIGTILILMPAMTDLGDLLAITGAVTLLAAWVANGSERIAYAGWQIGIAFYLTVLQGTGPTLDMETARDRIVGIIVGNIVVSVIFTFIWPVRVADVARAGLADALDKLAAMLRPGQGGIAAQAGLRQAFDASIGQARAVLVNEPYEDAIKNHHTAHAIDSGVAGAVQALGLPVSVLTALRAADGGAAGSAFAAHDGALSAWFTRCGHWVRTGAGGDHVAASLPPPPVMPDAGDTDQQVARIYWYRALDGALRAILARTGAGAAAADIVSGEAAHAPA